MRLGGICRRRLHRDGGVGWTTVVHRPRAFLEMTEASINCRPHQESSWGASQAVTMPRLGFSRPFGETDSLPPSHSLTLSITCTLTGIVVGKLGRGAE